MSRRSVHISKLTEAAWIQDTRTMTGRHRAILELFADYQSATQAIIVLRAFRRDSTIEYELVEIPTSIFTPVRDLTPRQTQDASIKIPPGSVAGDFTIRIDRSDAKITLSTIDLRVCIVHGRWIIVPHYSI